MLNMVSRLTMLAALPLGAASVEGIVTDPSAAAIAGASLTLCHPSGIEIARAKTSPDGRFRFSPISGSRWVLHARADGFEPAEFAVAEGSHTLALHIAAPSSRVTVTAVRGAAFDDTGAAPVTAIRWRDSSLAAPAPTLGHWLAGAPGVFLQQTSTAQVSPFLRGLTGYHVVNLIDGVRFNNTSFRSGPNQYLAFADPAQASRVEAMLGPASAQYGSDALGGAIHIATPDARFAASDSRELHGDASLFTGSADLSAGAAAQLSYGTPKIAMLAGTHGRRHGDLRAGQAADSHNAFRRFFSLDDAQIRALTGSRLQDTAFSQAGLHTKLALRPSTGQSATFWCQRSAQYGAAGYKDLLGGLGRLQSDFDPQSLDFLYGRYEKLALGPLDSLSGTVSFNQQTDGTARRNLRISDPLTRDWNRVRSLGYSAQATTQNRNSLYAVFGADLYRESVASRRDIDGTPAPPLYPAGARYATSGLFAQASLDLPHRFRASLGGRYTHIAYDARRFRDWTWNVSLAYDATPWLGFHFLAGRGFRAPNINDLGATGLNDLGYEIPAELAPDALLGNSAGENATSLGKTAGNLRAESLLNYEAGVRMAASPRFSARLQAFTASLRDPIVRRTLLFPATQVPTQLAGLAVTPIAPTPSQLAQGVVTVATALDPRAVKAFVNDGRSRYSGIEALATWTPASRWLAEARYSFLAGRDLDPNRHIRRLPPQIGHARLRYTASRRWWIQSDASAAGAQRRLSGGDIDDERIGASRRRSDIAAFFAGSRVAPYLDAAGRFTPTGETLRQIQDRLLPGVADSVRLPLYTATSGWLSLSFRSGLPLAEHWTLLAALENAFDRNFRFHGSGIDAPGRGAYVALQVHW